MERAGIAFAIALVAESQPGRTMLKKAAKHIRRVRTRCQKVSAEVDEVGNAIDDGNKGEVIDSEEIYADTLCQPENMLEMLEMLLALVQERSSLFSINQ